MAVIPEYQTADTLVILLLPAVQQKMSEETGARMRAESRVVEVEKQCSMLEFDLKQSVQKMEQLMKQKERLEDEVIEGFIACGFAPFSSSCNSAYNSRAYSSPGEESANTDGAGVEQTHPDAERPEDPHAGGGSSQVFGEAAQTRDQHVTGEQTLTGVPAGTADQVSLS